MNQETNAEKPNSLNEKPINWLISNTIRFLAIDAIQKANSGHPGMPMGCSDIATVLWTKFIKINPKNPKWINRDRFVLSAGHGSMLLYSLLHLSGYGLSLEDIKNFRQLGSITPGHPEYDETPGVETTTGPLGQGFANGVGMALAAKWMGAQFNTEDFPEIISPKIYGIAGDGDLMEGIASEAASFAGHYKLDNIIYFYDDNKITIDGKTDISFSTEDVGKRFQAYGWNVQKINGQNFEEIEKSTKKAIKSKGKPNLIICKTTIGYGSPNKANNSEVHGSPLGKDEVLLTKQNLGWTLESDFYVPPAVYEFFDEKQREWIKLENKWLHKFDKYKAKYPEKAAKLENFLKKDLPLNLNDILPKFTEIQSEATRVSSGKTLAAIYPSIENLIGGSADLTPSNNTFVKGSATLSPANFGGRYIHYGIREHAMAGIMNGMALFGGMIPYGGTFLIFSEYMRPSIRLAAMMKQQVIYVFTHDSIFLGEDGPTHQPIEQLASLRAIPNLCVIRPSDPCTTAIAWKIALENKTCPTALLLTRQGVPVFNWSEMPSKPADIEKGAIIIYGDVMQKPDLYLVASGSETNLILQTAKKLAEQGIKAICIDVPSWDLFEKQPEEYKQKIFPADMQKCILVEAGSSMGWSKYLGRNYTKITIDGRFGASAPIKGLAEKFGFTTDNIINKALELLKK